MSLRTATDLKGSNVPKAEVRVLSLVAGIFPNILKSVSTFYRCLVMGKENLKDVLYVSQ